MLLPALLFQAAAAAPPAGHPAPRLHETQRESSVRKLCGSRQHGRAETGIRVLPRALCGASRDLGDQKEGGEPMSEVRQESKAITTTDLAAAGRQHAPIEEEALPAAREHEEIPDSQPPVSLFAGDQAQRFRSEWNDIQITFVDEPRGAVEKADGLVARVIQQLAQVFADERARLEGEWS